MNEKLIIYNSDNIEIRLAKSNIVHYFAYDSQIIKTGYVNDEIIEIYLTDIGNNQYIFNVIRINGYFYKFPFKICYDILGSDNQLTFMTKNYIRKKKILNL